jgi:hypothetical protein
MPRQFDVETLVAAAGGQRRPCLSPFRGWRRQARVVGKLGVPLMALGLVSLLSSSRILRRGVLVGRFLDARMDLAVMPEV